MRKLKTILLFKHLIFIILLISCIKVIFFINNYKFHFNDGENKGVVTSITNKDDYSVIDIKSNINYRAYIDNRDLNIGDIIEFKFVNKEVSNNTIFNTFNYKKYLKSRNIKQVITITNCEKLGINKYYKFKGVLRKMVLSKKSNTYILTFLCGDKSYFDNDIKYSFTNNGISHLLCVSGFHIYFIFNFLISVLRKMIKKEYVIILFLIIFSCIYLIMTSFMISLFRAILIFFLQYFKKRYDINIHSIYLLIFIFSISLILWPEVIFNIGFYYTFILSFYLIIYNHKLNNIFKLSLFCFIISMPITIFNNYNINVLGIIFSIVSSLFICYLIYPLCFLSLISKTADGILYKLSNIFNYINLKIDGVHLFRIVIPKVSVYLVIMLYIIYLLYIIKPNKSLIILYLFMFFCVIFNKYFDINYYIYFLDVKQGDSIVIIGENHKNVTIIDTGGIVNNDYLKYSVKQFLYSVGVGKINNLIITHGDYDHMGEAINLVNNFKVEKVIFNCGEYNDLEQELIKVLDKKKIPYYSCIKELNIDNNKLYFLQTKEYDNENDNSNVIYTEINGYTFMFMGDAGIKREQDILDKYNISNIDVLKVGHHGSKTSSSNEFINNMNPKYSVISVGKNNRYGHPNKETLDTLKDSTIYRTDQDGSIMFKIKNNKLNIQ